MPSHTPSELQKVVAKLFLPRFLDHPRELAVCDVAKAIPLPGGVLEVLKPTSFVLRRGEWWTVFGAQSSGRSTLLNAISDTAFPSAGHVSVDGRPLQRGEVVHVPTEFHANSWSATVSDHLMQLLSHSGFGFGRRESERRINAVFSLYGQGQLLDGRIAELTRLQHAFARVLAATLSAPAFVLVDEADYRLRGGAAAEATDFADVVLRRDLGAGLVTTTHDVIEATPGDHVAYIANGSWSVWL